MKKLFFLLAGLLMCLGSSAQIAENGVELFPNTPFDANTESLHYDATGVSDQTVKDKLLADPTKWYQTTASADYAGAVVDDGGYEIASLIYKKSANWYTNFIATRSTAKLVAGVYHISLKARVQDATAPVAFYLKMGRWDGATQVGSAEIGMKRVGNANNMEFVKGNSSGALKFEPALGSAYTECSADIYISEPTDESAFFARMYFSFPEFSAAAATSTDGSIRLDVKDISLKRTGDLPPMAQKVYIRNVGDTESWKNVTVASDGTTAIVDADNLLAVPEAKAWYFAPGAYQLPNITLDSVKMYGGFTGKESAVDDAAIAARERADLDGNGKIEPWEFANRVYFQAADSVPTAAAGIRLLMEKDALLDGVTIRNMYSNYKCAISVGALVDPDKPATSIPEDASADMRNCIITNCVLGNVSGLLAIGDYSTVDGCLMSDCKTLGSTRVIAMSGYQCVLKNSRIRNNTLTGGSVYLLQPRVAMDGAAPTIENCVFQNNGTGSYGLVRCVAGAASQDAAHFVNCTFFHNSGASAIEFIGASGNVINCIIASHSASIRGNQTAGNAIVNVVNSAMNKALNNSGCISMTGSSVKSTIATMHFVDPVTIAEGYLDPVTAADEYAKLLTSTQSISEFPTWKEDSVTTDTIYGVKSFTYADLRSNNVTIDAPATDIMGNASVSGFQTVGAYQPTAVATAINGTATTSGTIHISPVAVDGAVEITNAASARVEIYSCTGALVKNVTLRSQRMDVSDLQRGLYIVRVNAGNNSSVRRVVIR